MNLVSWERVCTPKVFGGAGLRRLEAMNKAMLCKWLWRFAHEPSSLWREVVAAKFGNANGWELAVPRGPFGHSMWRGILQVLPLFRECLLLKVRDGR